MLMKEALRTLTRRPDQELLKRYKMAVIAKRVIEDPKNKYGDKTMALKEFVKETRFGRETLYRYAAVARIWTKAEFRNFLDYLALESKPNILSWSHFIEVVIIKDRAQAESLIELAIEKCLSVKAFKSHIKTYCENRTT